MKKSLTENESGVALVTALLVLMLASGLMAGMFAALLANQRSHATDRDQSVAYAAAHAGLEKLTAGLAAQFSADFSPSAAQLAIVDNTPPAIAGFEYTSPGGAAGSGYAITFTPDPVPGVNFGNPLAFANRAITTGPFEGFNGLITPYTITVTARSTTGNSEVRLRRELQTVAVPVFQFGIFGEKSLGFHAGPNFDFGGRVHTNESLFLASGNASTLTFRDKITAFTQVMRNYLSNGRSITLTGHGGSVSIPMVIGGAPADYRLLTAAESSGTTAVPWGGWKNLSESTYRTNIRTEATGAKRLILPIVTTDTTPIDLIRRPAALSNEAIANPTVFGQRYFAQASLRILLSDRAADLTGLPTITAGAPFDLANLAATGYAAPAGQPPVAASPVGEPFNPVNGVTLARVSAIAGATLTVQTSPDGAAGWVVGVPAWLKQPAANVLARATVSGFNLPCTGLAPNSLLGCDTNVAPTAATRHPMYPANTQITITLGNGTTVNVLTSGVANANSQTIPINGFNPALQYVSTRSFFVGEDPVTCTGFSRTPILTDGIANALTGCTWAAAPAGNGLAVNEPLYTGATTLAATPLLHGFIKIERQDAAGVWTDVTQEILALGFAAPNQQGTLCADPSQFAIIRLQRLRDSGMTAAGACTGAATVTNYATGPTPPTATDFWPNTIFDAREGSSRPLATTAGMNVGGVFSYVALDVFNFQRWVTGVIPGTGNLVLNNNGYIIYFSDRRGDHNETIVGDPETGEYGFEDSINPGVAAFTKDNILNPGEDFNENTTLQSYGETPSVVAGVVPAGAVAFMGFNAASRPWDPIPLLYSGRGRLARPVLFRRALKIINGGMVGAVNNLPASGFTVTSENPVYVQGNFNATTASVTAEPNVPTAIIADSITLLSNVFNDAMTFEYPNNAPARVASSTSYRFAMATGKTVPFPKPTWSAVEEMGSDGGVHNFMKMLENWNPGGVSQTVRYRGSMVSLYYSRQAVGIYRADNNIYSPPTRTYNFDTDFLTPALLPPGTPMFRDINTLKFRQILRPNQ